MLLGLLLGGVVTGAVGWTWVRHKIAAAERQRQRDLDRFGLHEVHERLLTAVTQDRLPLGTDPRSFVVETMRQMLRELEATPPDQQQAAVVQPNTEVVRLACEELVRMNLMTPSADRTSYVFRRSPHLRPGERPS